MGTKVKRHSPDYYVTDGNNELPVEFAPVDGTEIVKYSEDGKHAVVGYLCQDDEPGDPRTEWDNMATMACWHSRYKLGDKQPSEDGETFLRNLASDYTDKDTDEMKPDKVWAIIEDHYFILPLFLYDHSGITMSTSSGRFSAADSAGWDWGQVGWIYMTKEKAKQEMSRKVGKKFVPIKRFTQEDTNRAFDILRGEVETYDMYLTGDVYGVCVNAAVNVGTEEEPEWEALSETGIIGYTGPPDNYHAISGNMWEDACWGYYGYKYAKEELESQVESMLKRLNEAKWADPEDPDQMPLFGEGAGI